MIRSRQEDPQGGDHQLVLVLALVLVLGQDPQRVLEQELGQEQEQELVLVLVLARVLVLVQGPNRSLRERNIRWGW
jgi:hypothetical protein